MFIGKKEWLRGPATANTDCSVRGGRLMASSDELLRMAPISCGAARTSGQSGRFSRLRESDPSPSARSSVRIEHRPSKPETMNAPRSSLLFSSTNRSPTPSIVVSRCAVFRRLWQSVANDRRGISSASIRLSEPSIAFQPRTRESRCNGSGWLRMGRSIHQRQNKR